MDSQINTGEKRWDNQEWVIQRHWQHWVHGAKTRRKTMGQSRMGNPETLATLGTRAKTRRKAMGQSRMGNPETLATLGTRGEDEEKSDGVIKNG
jgi:hypothetical protein